MSKGFKEQTEEYLDKLREIHNESIDFVFKNPEKWFEDEYRRAQMMRLAKGVAIATFFDDYVVSTMKDMRKKLPDAVGTDKAGANFLAIIYASNFIESAIEVLNDNTEADQETKKEG